MGRYEPGSFGSDPIYWVDGRTPKREINVDGVIRTERVPAKPFRKFVNLAGNVIFLDLTEAAGQRSRTDYSVKRVEKKLAAGFVPFDECPLATGRLPASLVKDGDEKCAEYVDENGFPIQIPNRVKPCPHLQRLIDVRREEAIRRNEGKKAAFRSSLDRLAEQVTDTSNRQLDLLEAFAKEKGKAPRKRKQKEDKPVE